MVFDIFYNLVPSGTIDIFKLFIRVSYINIFTSVLFLMLQNILSRNYLVNKFCKSWWVTKQVSTELNLCCQLKTSTEFYIMHFSLWHNTYFDPKSSVSIVAPRAVVMNTCHVHAIRKQQPSTSEFQEIIIFNSENFPKLVSAPSNS